MEVNMNLAQALKRIEALEERIRKLEAAPKQEVHYHTHQAPLYGPTMPAWNNPAPLWTPRPPYEVTCNLGSAQ